MTQDLLSTIPGIYEAMHKLVVEAGEAQSPQVPVIQFAIGQNEPNKYIMFSEVRQEPYEWEMIGSFVQKERYDIVGRATVYAGDSPFDNPGIVQTTINEVYTLFQACVMTPVMSNRTMPYFGFGEGGNVGTGQGPYLMLPRESQPTFGPAEMSGGASGWYGVLDWSFHFEALLQPH